MLLTEKKDVSSNYERVDPNLKKMEELQDFKFEDLIDKIFEEQTVRKMFFEGDQMLYSALNYDGVFKYISPSWSRCLGLTNKEIKSIPFSVLLHPDDVPISMDCYEFFSTYGEPAYEMIANRYRKLDGSYATIQWFKPVLAKELDLWLFTAYEIPAGHKGITIYNSKYEPFNWKNDAEGENKEENR